MASPFGPRSGIERSLSANPDPAHNLEFGPQIICEERTGAELGSPTPVNHNLIHGPVPAGKQENCQPRAGRQVPDRTLRIMRSLREKSGALRVAFMTRTTPEARRLA